MVKVTTGGEDEEGKLGIAKNGDLSCLFHQPFPSLGEAYLSAALVFDSLQFHLPPTH
ncbi:hypothetical protein LINGRAHAP2_LOCUS18271 [Linum grandiflorum]